MGVGDLQALGVGDLQAFVRSCRPKSALAALTVLARTFAVAAVRVAFVRSRTRSRCAHRGSRAGSGRLPTWPSRRNT